MVRYVAAGSITAMRTIRLCHYGLWCYEMSANGPVGHSVTRFLLPPAMTDPHHSCFLSSNTLVDFSEG
ncbi:hypothetical protein TNCV_2370161 [Trichonephila clavipes]|nr:hypothetical protein TNCV_2370161 [Trichonephila clavipes]